MTEGRTEGVVRDLLSVSDGIVYAAERGDAEPDSNGR